jgi:putative transposase
LTRTRYRILDPTRPYFLTDSIVAWLPLFSHPALAEIVLNSWRYLQSEGRITLYAYVIMENHVHWIAQGDDLSGAIQSFKSFTAKEMIAALEKATAWTLLQELEYYKLRHKLACRYQVWQEGSHPQEVADEPMMRQKLDYTRNNPVRRGWVLEPEHWRRSSARNYAGMPGELEITMPW